MSHEPDSLILRMLRDMRAENGETRSEMRNGFADLRSEMTSLRADVAADIATIRKEVVEQKFVDFLSQYSFDAVHLNTIKGYLEKYFGKHAQNQKNDSEAIQNRITEINQQIDNLITLQTNGSISTTLLSNRVQKFELELEELTDLLKVKTEEKVDINDLLKFATKVLKQPHLLWQKSPLDIKKRIQVFDFPNGIVFDGANFRTPKVCSIYKLKEQIDTNKLLVVNSRFPGKNTVSTHVLLHSDFLLLETKEFWEQIVQELKQLQGIVET